MGKGPKISDIPVLVPATLEQSPMSFPLMSLLFTEPPTPPSGSLK